MLYKDKDSMQYFDAAIRLEWLETNGLGGWSCSTLMGCNTRRYHGLLVAATVPPAERMVLLSKLDETITIDGNRFELGTNNYGDTTHPRGYEYLTSFTKDMFPRFVYDAGGVTLKKTVAMIHGENTVVIRYEVVGAPQPFMLELLPLVSYRGYHGLAHANNSIHYDASFKGNTFHARPYDGTPDLYISIPGSKYQHNPAWYYHFNYIEEKNRGLDFVEDLFSYGRFEISLQAGDTIGIVISTDNPGKRDAGSLLESETKRRKKLLKDQPKDETLTQLVLAADQFIVRRGEGLKTVIAGYHWFTDWGRDTMISLPGLCLSTGRFEDAKKILAAFAGSVSRGMLPNRFLDGGEPPEYNNVDGTLWFFIAIHKYLLATNDKRFVLKEILPVLKEIIEFYQKGTRYNIHTEEDGLLYSGENGVQLTWMDARIGDWVVTPRTGKAVEVNALWFNALQIFATLLDLDGNKSLASATRKQAALLKVNFNKIFWNEETGCLYDVVEDHRKDDTLRPNQLFAISLPFPLLDSDKIAAVLQVVTDQLYTPVGLRTLPVWHSSYAGRYLGNPLQRDSAYHQGTVWSWLLGPYVDAIIQRGGLNAKTEALEVIQHFRFHLAEACIGSVSEVFDGNPPHRPGGCVAQAWGVAEVLRVMKDYELYETAEKVKRQTSNVKGETSNVKRET